MRCAWNSRIGRLATLRRGLGAGLLGLGLIALGPSSAGAEAQGPRLTNADARPVAATASLAAQIQTLAGQQSEPVWIAYVQPSARPRMQSCCNGDSSYRGGDCCGACRLEKEGGTTTHSNAPHPAPAATAAGTAPAPIKLEGSTEIVILARVAEKKVERVRMFSPDCALDAGGLRVYTLTGVTPAASVAWLETLVRDDEVVPRRSERIAGGAIAAIALHRDPAADAALDRIVAPGRARENRRNAAFWLASARGKHGFDVVQRLVKDETDQDLRKHAVFCLTVSDEPGATAVLLDVARTSPSPDVRGQALFWLGNAAGKKAVGAITDAIENDPDTQVKERAVFALSQLPNKEGTPLLIEVAKTNRNPSVRKKAMFWLGQSKDPRALEFFETILK